MLPAGRVRFQSLLPIALAFAPLFALPEVATSSARGARPADDETSEEGEPASVLTWRVSYAAALEEARLRNAVIYLIFTQDSDSVIPGELFQNPAMRKYAEERLVMVAAHPKFDGPLPHKPDWIKEKATGRRVTRCPYYPTISCRQHQAIASELPKNLTPNRTPCEFLLAPNGKIIRDGRTHPIDPNEFRPERYVAAFRAAQKKVGRRTVAGDVYRMLKRAEADLEVPAQVGRGAADLRKVKKRRLRFPKPFREWIDRVEKSYLERGNARIDQVIASKSSTKEKIEQLAKIQAEYDGYPVEDRARKAKNELTDK